MAPGANYFLLQRLCESYAKNFQKLPTVVTHLPLYPKNLPTNPIILFPYKKLEEVTPVTKAVRFNVLCLDSFFSLKSLPYTRSLPQAL